MNYKNTHIELTIISHSGRENKVKTTILNSINTYLIRNKGAVSDFNLIKDIVDRNIDSEEDEINAKLPIPLYLGLIGTMIGIVLGLQFLPPITEMVGENSNTSGIDGLLGGVKIAMIASLVGLGFTVYGTGFLFKGAKQNVEENKNNFFSFIQSKLLPKLSENTSSSIYSLQNNLLKFNDDFKGNMNSFQGILTDVHSSLDSQVQLVEELKKVDLATMAKANVTVLKELKLSVGQLESFGQYMSQMNSFVKNTAELNTTVKEQLEVIGDVSSIIKNLNQNAENQLEISRYLASYFQQFDSREQHFSDSITKFDSTVNDLLENLKISFIERAQEFNSVDFELNTGFKTLFDGISKSMSSMFEDQQSNIKELSIQIKELNNFKLDVSKLSSEIAKQNEKIDAISAGNIDPFKKLKISKVLKFSVFLFLFLGIIVLSTFVYSLISNFF